MSSLPIVLPIVMFGLHCYGRKRRPHFALSAEKDVPSSPTHVLEHHPIPVPLKRLIYRVRMTRFGMMSWKDVELYSRQKLVHLP